MSRTYAHFVGVGGAGMSGIAKVLHDRGVAVTGSDMRMSRYAVALRDAGVPVHIGHDASNLGDPEIVVVSTAIPGNNPELIEAKRRGLTIWQRARMLAELAGERHTVAIAGTHGKTTTSSMMSAALMALDLDPTFLIGGELNDVGSNARCGLGPHFVVEADESDGSFLLLDPHVAIVTNVEADHMDHYASFDEIVETFGRFLDKVHAEGVAVICRDDEALMRLAPRCPGRVVTYGRCEAADVRLLSCRAVGAGSEFVVGLPGGSSVTCSTAVPGEHMALNATGVLAAIHAMGLSVETAAAGIASFGGVKRRFEKVGEAGGALVVDDYAHHPTEVRATLAGARGAVQGEVWVVFQPHRYSRTAAFAREFGASFDQADHIVLLDVYSAGEAPVPGVSGKTLVDAVLRHKPRTRLAYFPHHSEVPGYLADRVARGDLVMTMGAGDVTTLGPEIVRAVEERSLEAGRP